MTSTVVNVLDGTRPCIHSVWSVPASEEATIDAFWKEHEVWMRTKHSMGPLNTTGGPRLLQFWIAKGAEMEDPMAQPPVPTGNILYIMSEAYLEAADIGMHMEQCGAEKGEWMAKMMEYSASYSKHMDVGCTMNFTGLVDTEDFATPSIYQAGDPCIHMIQSVPSSEEATMDAFWKEHEAWMRTCHDLTREGDDSERVRITSFNIRKGAEMEDAMAQPPVPTGNILYIMSESYAAASGVAKHLELCSAQKGEWMAQLMAYNGKYAKFIEIGQTSVFTCLGK